MKTTLRFSIELISVTVILVALLFFMIPQFLAAQNINAAENFPDPTFRAHIEKDIFNCEPGQRFYARDLAAISGLALLHSSGDIKTVKGIEYFSGLIELHLAEQHPLQRIDLAANHQLRDVFLENNHGLQEIVFPRPSRVRKLLWRNSGLRQIDLSGLSTLEELYLGKNHIDQLDVSMLPKLRALICEENQLSHLDLSNNSNIDVLILANNHFETIPDVSQLKHLAALDVRGNPLPKESPETIQKLAERLGPAVYYPPSINDGRLKSGFAFDPQRLPSN